MQSPQPPIKPNPYQGYLRILAIIHYVVAGSTLCAGLMVFVVGIFMLAALEGATPMLCMMVVFFGMAAITVVAAVLAYNCGRCLHLQQDYDFCWKMSVVECILIPLLGVPTLILMLKPEVKAQFRETT